MQNPGLRPPALHEWGVLVHTALIPAPGREQQKDHEFRVHGKKETLSQNTKSSVGAAMETETQHTQAEALPELERRAGDLVMPRTGARA